jgi:nucleoside-diphosphate-sugar epimerase
VKDCKYVLHVASPFPLATPSDPDDLIKPALEGTLSVLRACAEQPSIKRVVVTSSVLAVYGNKFESIDSFSVPAFPLLVLSHLVDACSPSSRSHHSDSERVRSSEDVGRTVLDRREQQQH